MINLMVRKLSLKCFLVIKKFLCQLILLILNIRQISKFLVFFYEYQDIFVFSFNQFGCINLVQRSIDRGLCINQIIFIQSFISLKGDYREVYVGM